MKQTEADGVDDIRVPEIKGFDKADKVAIEAMTMLRELIAAQSRTKAEIAASLSKSEQELEDWLSNPGKAGFVDWLRVYLTVAGATSSSSDEIDLLDSIEHPELFRAKYKPWKPDSHRVEELQSSSTQKILDLFGHAAVMVASRDKVTAESLADDFELLSKKVRKASS